VSGTIGLCADELSRYSAFTVSLAGVLEDMAGQDWTLRIACGRSIVRNCNHLWDACEGDSLWMQGDDHMFAADTLKRLLAHQVDVVVPMILMRQKPFPPVLFEGENENGSMRLMQNIPPNELIQVYAAGTGGMLISKEAREAVGPSPFKFTELPGGESLGEDFTLCARFREAGIPIHCDTSTAMGHLSTTAVWPEHTDDGWAVRLDFNSGAQT
jgi:hypothetical protein